MPRALLCFSFVAACFCTAAHGGDLWLGDGRPLPSGDAALYANEPAPEFRAEFVLPPGHSGDVNVRIACAGCYRLTVQGACISETSLMPLWSPFDKTVYSDSLCIPKEVLAPHPGTNDIRVLLGNGFRSLSPLRFWGRVNFRKNLASGRPCFRLSMDVPGVSLAWSWRESQVMRNCVFLGTEIDAARGDSNDWRPASAVPGPAGRIVPRRAPALGVRKILQGKSRWIEPGSVQIVDLGENVTGCPVFRFRGLPRGRRVEIVYGERLTSDGRVNVLTQTAGQIKPGRCAGGPGAPNLACARDVYVAAGRQDETFEPYFTWHICRYLEVRGYDRLLSADEILYHAVSAKLENASPGASFSCGVADLDNLHAVCRRTFLNNLLSVQSDCPGRERLGYGGDIVATAEAMILNWDMKEFYLKTLQDYADEAASDGWITETAPHVGIADRGYGGRAGPIGWTLVVPHLIDAIVRHYPDAAERALAYYPVCARYVELMAAKFPNGIVPTCIGDHEGLDRPPQDVMATAHWHEFVRLTASFANRLGKREQAARYAALSARIAEAFRSRYVREGIVAGGSQGAQATALHLGLLRREDVPMAEKALLSALEKTQYAPTTGIFSTRYMLMYLSEHGYRDVAERVVRSRAAQGWMRMLDRGATTLWETWKESDDVFSNCHPMFGSVDEWILRFGAR